MQVGLLLIGLLCMICGCSESVDEPVVDADANRESNFLALGDSYTIGEGVARDDRWPVQLAKALRVGGTDVLDPRIVAVTGWTCADLSAALDREPSGRQYAMVTLLIGVNDQYRGGSADAYRKPFTDLLHRAIALAGGVPSNVIVVSIPDWGATPFGQAERRGSDAIGNAIDAFNVVNREEAVRAGVRYVDVTPVSREVRTDRSFAADDGLHPSATMYAKWVELALPAAKDIARTRAIPPTAK